MGCAAARPRSAVVAKKGRLVQVGRTRGLVGSPRQISVVLLTIAGVVFSGAAPISMAAAAAPPIASAATPPTRSSLLKPPFPGLEGRAIRRGEKWSLGICPGNGPSGSGPSVTAVVVLFCGVPGRRLSMAAWAPTRQVACRHRDSPVRSNKTGGGLGDGQVLRFFGVPRPRCSIRYDGSMISVRACRLSLSCQSSG